MPSRPVRDEVKRVLVYHLHVESVSDAKEERTDVSVMRRREMDETFPASTSSLLTNLRDLRKEEDVIMMNTIV